MTDSGEAMTPWSLIEMKGRGERIAIGTAHDHLTGKLADSAGIDAVVVGDSLAVTVLGEGDISRARIEDMIVFARAVASGAKRALVIGDIPFGCYQPSDDLAVASATRMVKEGHVGAVKVEGAGTTISRAKAIADAGIPVMGHLIPPEAAWVTDAWRRSPSELAAQTLADAVAYERTGCFAVLVESVPSPVAAEIARRLQVPVIGYGSGPSCDGQNVSVFDILGLSQPSPFSRNWADLAGEALRAGEAFVADVRSGAFPSEEEAAKMSDEQARLFSVAAGEQNPDHD